MTTYNPLIQYERKRTRQRAIKAMCAHCMGCTKDHIEPGFRESIRNCTAPSCPLYFYRPYQEKETVDAVAHPAN